MKRKRLQSFLPAAKLRRSTSRVPLCTLLGEAILREFTKMATLGEVVSHQEFAIPLDSQLTFGSIPSAKWVKQKIFDQNDQEQSLTVSYAAGTIEVAIFFHLIKVRSIWRSEVWLSMRVSHYDNIWCILAIVVWEADHKYVITKRDVHMHLHIWHLWIFMWREERAANSDRQHHNVELQGCCHPFGDCCVVIDCKGGPCCKFVSW